MNVLFVEDDSMNRRVVKDMLDVAGAVMTGAESAEIGLRLIDEQDFDIVLMDLRMPGMDGMTAINPHSPSKSLILLSGSQYFRYKSWC